MDALYWFSLRYFLIVITLEKHFLLFSHSLCMWIISFKGRCMALVQAATDLPEQGAVDDRDTFLHGVRDLLSIYSSKRSRERHISFLEEKRIPC